MQKHDPIKLTPNERIELGSISRHPGMAILLEKILATHVRQQLEMVHSVQPDDPDRITRIDGICAVANGMKLAYELLLKEIDLNWRTLQAEEEQRKIEAKNEKGEAQ